MVLYALFFSWGHPATTPVPSAATSHPAATKIENQPRRRLPKAHRNSPPSPPLPLSPYHAPLPFRAQTSHYCGGFVDIVYHFGSRPNMPTPHHTHHSCRQRRSLPTLLRPPPPPPFTITLHFYGGCTGSTLYSPSPVTHRLLSPLSPPSLAQPTVLFTHSFSGDDCVGSPCLWPLFYATKHENSRGGGFLRHRLWRSCAASTTFPSTA